MNRRRLFAASAAAALPAIAAPMVEMHVADITPVAPIVERYVSDFGTLAFRYARYEPTRPWILVNNADYYLGNDHE
jgi:hypothetical protein